MITKPIILYVDDEIINLQLFQYTFEKNFDIVIAISGAKGFEVIEKNANIDLVISDLKMPGMGGIEFVTKVKKLRPNLPCIMLSGYDENVEIEEALTNNLIDDYIVKPFRKPKVLDCINNLLKNNN